VKEGVGYLVYIAMYHGVHQLVERPFHLGKDGRKGGMKKGRKGVREEGGKNERKKTTGGRKEG
jgi:hypothetical protein